MARIQRVRPLAGPMINSAAKQIHTPSFRGDAKHRTRNLEIPRCAIAHLRSGPSDRPGRTECGLPPLARNDERLALRQLRFAWPGRRDLRTSTHDSRRVAPVAIAAAAVRFSTPSL